MRYNEVWAKTVRDNKFSHKHILFWKPFLRYFKKKKKKAFPIYPIKTYRKLSVLSEFY